MSWLIHAFVTWLIAVICDVTHCTHMWHESLRWYVTCVIVLTCTHMTHVPSHVIYQCNDSWHKRVHSYMKWRIHMIWHFHTWHDSFMYVKWDMSSRNVSLSYILSYILNIHKGYASFIYGMTKQATHSIWPRFCEDATWLIHVWHGILLRGMICNMCDMTHFNSYGT